MDDEANTQPRAEYEEAVKAFLETKWTGSQQCPICQTTAWHIGDLVEHRGFRGPNPWGILESKSVTPVALLFCSNCGYQIAFNALIAGIPTVPIRDAGQGGKPSQ